MPRGLALVLLTLALGCARSGDADPAESAPSDAGSEPPPAWSATPPTAPIAVHEGPVRIQVLSLELAADDPIATMTAVRRIVVSLGGEITNANGNAGSAANLSATLPPAAIERLSHGISQLPGDVRSESTSVNDMTQHCDTLRDRLQQLGIADAELERIMRSSHDPQMFDAMLVQRELGTRERENLRQQLATLVQQAKRAQFNVTIQPSGGAPPQVIRDPVRLGDEG